MAKKKVIKSEAKPGKREWSPDTTISAVNDVESTNVTDTTPDNKALLAKQESVIASNVGAFLLLGEALRGQQRVRRLGAVRGHRQ